MKKTLDRKWWHDSVVYQVYPRSFMDSNRDGIGDIRGIIEKLDYLQNLGIDVIWLSPVYKSPNKDMGYDISDYCDIMDEFGNMEDMDNLIKEAHKKGIKIVMDLVVNHTSDQHKWFIEGRKSKDNKYHDYYVWKKAKDGQVPNELTSTFTGSAWEYNEPTDEYYLHLFSVEQPDLNWENEDLRKEIYDMINFWLDKGIGGFRLDVIDLIGKEPDKLITSNGPKLHEYLREMNENTFGKCDVLTVGETWGATPDIAKEYTRPERKELSMVFQFEHMSVDKIEGKRKWDIAPVNFIKLKQILSKWQVELKDEGWNSLFWNNHDLPRVVSRFGNDTKYRVESAKMLATILHMQKGTPYIYQGEEIGMTNMKFKDISYYKDIEAINIYKERTSQGYTHEEVMKSLHAKARDNARTPMQWNNDINGGFTTGTPWFEVNPNYEYINVEDALKDKNSIFYYYKELIKLRKNMDIIVYGDYQLLYEDDLNIYSYVRTMNDEMLLVVCNFFDKNVNFRLPEYIKYTTSEILISNYNVENSSPENINLRPYEAIVYKLTNK